MLSRVQETAVEGRLERKSWVEIWCFKRCFAPQGTRLWGITYLRHMPTYGRTLYTKQQRRNSIDNINTERERPFDSEGISLISTSVKLYG